MAGSMLPTIGSWLPSRQCQLSLPATMSSALASLSAAMILYKSSALHCSVSLRSLFF
jgi:hypothetical protein